MRNQFVYDACRALQITEPDIEVHARPHFAQCAEDLIVVSMVRALASIEGFDPQSQRYLEIGANHPVATSATYLLQRDLGMTGVLVEANPALVDTLRRVRTQDDVVNAAIAVTDDREIDFYCSNQSELSSLSRRFVEEWRAGTVGLQRVVKVPAMRINALLEQHFGARAPLYLSIDIEGLDLEILEDIDWERWRPALIQAEPSDHFVATNSSAMIEYMDSLGYRLVSRTDVNLVFADAFRTAAAGRFKPKGVNSSLPKIASHADTPSVGIVMRTQNRSVLLRRALESVRSQTYGNWQLVVVNDAGDPKPVDMLVSQLFASDPRVRVLHRSASSGMEAASNAGITLLETDLAIIHDDDDSWAPEFLSTMTHVLAERQRVLPSVRAVACRPNTVWENVVANQIEIERVEPWSASHLEPVNEGVLPLEKLLVRNQFPPIAFLFSLPSARDLGLFDESLPVLGDWDFHLRFARQHDIWLHPEYLAFYHLRATATGALGNTVMDGRSKHTLYARLIRNNSMRDGLNTNSGAQVALAMQMELREMMLSLNERLASHEALINTCRPAWRIVLSRLRNRFMRARA